MFSLAQLQLCCCGLCRALLKGCSSVALWRPVCASLHRQTLNCLGGTKGTGHLTAPEGSSLANYNPPPPPGSPSLSQLALSTSLPQCLCCLSRQALLGRNNTCWCHLRDLSPLSTRYAGLCLSVSGCEAHFNEPPFILCFSALLCSALLYPAQSNTDQRSQFQAHTVAKQLMVIPKIIFSL